MEAAAEVVVGRVGVVDYLNIDLADGDVGGDGEGGAAGVGDVFCHDDAVCGLDVAACLDLDGYGSGIGAVSVASHLGDSRLNNAHPLDGLAQVSVSGSPASAWMPDDGLLTTLLSLPCAATSAAKARTREIQERMVIVCLKLIPGIELYANCGVR